MAFKISQEKRGVVTTVSVVLIVISLVSIYFTQCSSPSAPKVDITPYTVVGEVAAEETAKVLGNKGKVLIITADTGKLVGTMAKIIENQLKAFQDTIQKQGGITVAGTEKVSSMMFSNLMMPMPGPGMPGAPGEKTETPAEYFLNLVKKHPNTSVDAIVSLVGFPMLSDEEISSLGQNIPKFIVVMPPGPPMSLKKLMEEQVIQCAITPRMTPPPPSTGTPTTPREKFNQSYEIVTPETEKAPANP